MRLRTITALAAVPALCMACGASAIAQGTWEFLGPAVGYQPTALCVTEQAVYVGMAEDDYYTGLGLYRYRFSDGQWDLFAFAGYRTTGLVVWGDLDENMVAIRYDNTLHRSEVMRSTDGGSNWTVTLWTGGSPTYGLVQAAADRQRLIISGGYHYSPDGGLTWSRFDCWNCMDNYDADFDPSDASVAFLTTMNALEAMVIEKSTDAGATWETACYPCWAYGIAVSRSQTDQVMAVLGSLCQVSSDAGATWESRPVPFAAKILCSPPWAPGSMFALGRNDAATAYEVRQTWDLGTTWLQCGDGLPAPPEPGVDLMSVFLEPHPASPDLYAGLEGSGVWRWRLEGESAPGVNGPGVNGPGGQGTLWVTPNPTSGRMSIWCELPRPDSVVLNLFDVCGRPIVSFSAGTRVAGPQEIDLRRPLADGRRLASGIYYLRLEAGRTRLDRKVALID